MTVLYDWPVHGLIAAAALTVPLAIVLLTKAAYHRKLLAPPSPLASLRWWAWAGIALCMLHQFEEHGVDFLGRPYHFRSFLCRSAGFSSLKSCPASAEFIFASNVCTLWVGCVLAALYAKTNPNLVLTTFSVHLVSSFTHIVPAYSALARGESWRTAYNPGLLSAALLVLPCSLWVLRLWWQQAGGVATGKPGRQGKPVGFLTKIVRLAVALYSGVCIYQTAMMSLAWRSLGIVGEDGLFAIQLGLGLLPLAVSRVLMPSF
ncbi:hypothetical protein DFJ73DRAFT_882226 [Zopfochytrium polystomum]|nr:hypothetical protein DFJ73DRAFT_882226 [Zopfochytrium polystomum]